MDPRIRIHTKMSWIRNIATGTYIHHLSGPQGDRKDPEIASWLEWRAKNRPAKPLLAVINRPPAAFASLAAGANRPGAKQQQQAPPQQQQPAVAPAPPQQQVQQPVTPQQQQLVPVIQQQQQQVVVNSSNSSSPKVPVMLPTRPVAAATSWAPAAIQTVRWGQIVLSFS
jgi:hypothetical protein